MIFNDEPEKPEWTLETSQIWWRVTWLVCAAICVLAVLVWWGRRHAANQAQGPIVVGSRGAVDLEAGKGHFDLAADHLSNLAGYDINVAADRILFHLQKWADEQQAAEDWIADPMFSGLPARLGINRQQTQLSRLTFSRADIFSLREAYWLRDLSRQIAQTGRLDQDLQQWLADNESRLGGDTTRQLKVALRLFDWTVRNIQQAPDETAAATADLDQPFPDGSEAVCWQALLTGRGHAWVRADVFILLARQQRLDVVMLGIDADPPRENAEPAPWTTAVLLDGQLYLLDPRLGLPIPRADGQGVATLADVLAEPALLRQLDVEGGPRYPIDEPDLSRVVAMLDATPDYLSQRMKLVESRLTGANKTVLSVQPSRLRQPLRQIEGITRVELWPLPYDALRYQGAIQRNQHARQRYGELMGAFEGDSPLAHARRQYFRGVLQSDPPEIGAKAHYLECRLPDSELAKAAAQHTANALQRAGVSAEDVEESQFRALQEKAQANLVRAKQAGSYWLGLLAFEEGKYHVAVDFLDSRTLQATPDGPWSQGAQYNLGRAYERIAQESGRREDWEKARAHYLADKDSPQYPGNWLRARRIDERLRNAAQPE